MATLWMWVDELLSNTEQVQITEARINLLLIMYGKKTPYLCATEKTMLTKSEGGGGVDPKCFLNNF